MLKNFLFLTNKNRKVVVRAKTDEEAKSIFKRYSDDKLKSVRKLRLTDLSESNEHILVLPNKEFI
ncbi:hypothetical protein [Heyndrickxia sporothermodurans]|uniref:hypothetical protein n=1 Tax=Heyndrickxia sporothermodurans TaxID=46224 RepID=UPI000D384F61|nr:hypothetical protein [Heyndrickxia sporothermodurans]PTY89746.1 hypothetical protein B5V90_07455 [Heyndrickxia sporothermodurans]